MSAYGFALAFFFVVLWAEEVATVALWLVALTSIIGGSLWAYYNARSSRCFHALYLADHPRLGDLSAAVLLAWREATSAVEAVGAIEAA